MLHLFPSFVFDLSQQSSRTLYNSRRSRKKPERLRLLETYETKQQQWKILSFRSPLINEKTKDAKKQKVIAYIVHSFLDSKVVNLHRKVNGITRNESGNKRRNTISTFSTIWIMNDSRTCAVLSFSNVIPRLFASAMFHSIRLCVHNDLETLVERVVERAIVLFACCPWIQHVTVIKTYYEIFRTSSSFFFVSNECSTHVRMLRKKSN